MATLQSQINILVASLAQLYDEIGKKDPNEGGQSGGSCTCSNPFSLVKLNYKNIDKVSNETFQALPTYVLAMDINDSMRVNEYDVSLGIYESTVDGHTFEYVVPEKYHDLNGFNGDIKTFRNDFIHGTFEGTDNLKILLNCDMQISLH